MKTQLLLIALGYKAVVFILLFISGHLPDFDQSSPHVYSRWDTIHYAAITEHGYSFEHQWAFFPGVPLLAALFPSQLATGLVFGLISIPSATTLYDLSLQTLNSPTIAYLSTLLSIFSSSPAVFHISGYAEPIFTFCAYRGLLECSYKRWYLAAFLFMIAGSLRSNGILLAGFHLWYLLVHPLLTSRKIPLENAFTCVVSLALIVLPFVTHNYNAWTAFCAERNSPPWCSRTLPLVYSHAQLKYWNVGLFRYWTVAQLPNFLLCLPVILLLLWSSSSQLLRQIPVLSAPRPVKQNQQKTHPEFYRKDLIPHAIHSLFLTLWITVGAHTQILLRLAPSLPFLYWSASRLLVEHPRLGKCWVYWSVVWGTASVILWATFLPPA